MKGPSAKQLGWFVVLWALGVGSLALVGFALRLLL